MLYFYLVYLHFLHDNLCSVAKLEMIPKQLTLISLLTQKLCSPILKYIVSAQGLNMTSSRPRLTSTDQTSCWSQMFSILCHLRVPIWHHLSHGWHPLTRHHVGHRCSLYCVISGSQYDIISATADIHLPDIMLVTDVLYIVSAQGPNMTSSRPRLTSTDQTSCWSQMFSVLCHLRVPIWHHLGHGWHPLTRHHVGHRCSLYCVISGSQYDIISATADIHLPDIMLVTDVLYIVSAQGPNMTSSRPRLTSTYQTSCWSQMFSILCQLRVPIWHHLGHGWHPLTRHHVGHRCSLYCVISGSQYDIISATADIHLPDIMLVTDVLYIVSAQGPNMTSSWPRLTSTHQTSCWSQMFSQQIGSRLSTTTSGEPPWP